MQMVFMVYESTPRKISKQIGATGSAATNLVYLHPYLSDFHWNTIAQRVANFGNENCVRQLVSSHRCACYKSATR
jgi:type IV secretory pathway VirB6-like protein